MRCIAAKTTIPVPEIYHFGGVARPRIPLGPFIIMDYTERERANPALKSDESDGLDPNISEQKLEFLYRQMGNIVLQLSTLAFSQIGPLVQDKDGQFSASGRPLI